MQKNYTFTNNPSISLFYEANLESVVQDYKRTFKIIINLIAIITGKKNFKVKFKDKYYTENGLILNLILIANKEIIEINICNSYVKIDYRNKCYEFKIDWVNERYFATLKRYTEKNENKKIIQSYQNNSTITCEILFSNRCIALEIPYYNKDTLNNLIFNNLDKDSSIKKIKKWYLNTIFKVQNDSERKFTTTLSIYDIKDEKKILKDKLVLKDGLITEYILSNIKDEIILRVKGTNVFDKEIVICNYNFNSEVNLNNEVNELLRKLIKVI